MYGLVSSIYFKLAIGVVLTSASEGWQQLMKKKIRLPFNDDVFKSPGVTAGDKSRGKSMKLRLQSQLGE